MSRLIILAFTTLLMLTGCATQGTKQSGLTDASAKLYKEGIPGTAKWAVLPFVNYSEEEEVNLQVERALMVQLPSKGITDARLYHEAEVEEETPSPKNTDRLAEAKRWAIEENISFVLSGEVYDWYFDEKGAPKVSIQLMVLDMRTDETIWSAKGENEPTREKDIHAVSRTLIHKLLQSLPVNPRK